MARLISVLKCISDASKEIGIQQDALIDVVGSRDQDVLQMMALLSAVADELLMDEPYRTSLGDELWVYDQDGVPKEEITANTDLIAFDPRLAINGIKWRFKQAKGLEYAEEMRDFTNRLNKIAVRSNGRVLDIYEDEGRVI
jgi:hypothetical protein